MPPKKLLEGKVVVFTGKLSMTRAQATAMAERSGAIVVSSVTAATNVIVVGADTGSKLDKAKAKGIEVWTEQEFLRKMTVEDHQERLGENKGRVIAATGTNKFQFSLAWDAAVDLDMHMKTPSGEVDFRCRDLDGVNLDVDRIPDWGKQTWAVRPVENIVADKVAPGNYTATVVYFSNFNNVKGAVPYTVHYRVGDIEDVYAGSAAKVGGTDIVLKFHADAAGNLQLGHIGAAKAAKPAPKKEAKKAAAKPAKKPAAKKPAAKKPAAKKPAAKKPAAKKPAKKPAAKKPSAKKPAAKKPAAKKAAKKPAKKASPKRK